MKMILQSTPQATDQYVDSTECQFHIMYINKSWGGINNPSRFIARVLLSAERSDTDKKTWLKDLLLNTYV